MTKRLRVSEAFRKEKRMPAQKVNGQRAKETYSCPDCGLLFEGGVWKKNAAGSRADVACKLCPACVQIRGRIAGGEVRLSGSFVTSHRQELLNRIRNVEKQTSEERPLERIITIKEVSKEIVVSATTEHLTARIGKAIQRDFGGDLKLKYAPADKFATAHWRRDA
jgi:hypothetical protein